MAFFKREQAARATRGAATHMTFRVGGQLYGAPVDMVSEVTALGRLSPLAESDPAVVGELELRGDALVVVDMGERLLGKPVVPSAHSCVLIVKRDKARSGCLFDAPEGLVSIPQNEIELSGCLVDELSGTAAIPPDDIREPESTSPSGQSYGLPLYRAKDETILLPQREAFYPR